MSGSTPKTADELRARYALEREKRLRPEGSEQYLEPAGRFAHLLDDPYTDAVPREPVAREVEVLIVGCGFGGLVTAARLRQAGIDDLLLTDRAGDVGGVWYWNRYPGAMCDTAAMIYLPLLEETGTVPSAKYVRAPEIHAHARRIAEVFELRERCLFSTGITEVAWQPDDHRWLVTTDRGDRLMARHVVLSTGPLHRPKLPGIPGIDTFAGPAFHTSRWEYDITGGDPLGAPMDRLAGRRIGIIGTGATAVQVVPEVARTAGDLYVFQRTPSSVDARNNHPIDPEWFATLEPGWQQRWLMNFTILQTGGFADEDLVKDGWTDISTRIRDRTVALIEAGEPFDASTIRRAYEMSDDEKMNEIRARIDAIVTDPATAEALKPWYRQLCKRPCFHDEYLAAFNQPNVHLVDTDGRGVTRIDESGVWVGDHHTGLDILVFASGFEVGTALSRRTGFEIRGPAGRTLGEHWAEGMRTYQGLQSHGFPNLHIIGMTQAGNLVSNIPHNLVEAAATTAAVIRHANESGALEVQPTAEAEATWLEGIDRATTGVFGNPECTPGYYNNEGRPIGPRERRNAVGDPRGPVAYFQHITEWRSNGRFEGLEFLR